MSDVNDGAPRSGWYPDPEDANFLRKWNGRGRLRVRRTRAGRTRWTTTAEAQRRGVVALAMFE